MPEAFIIDADLIAQKWGIGRAEMERYALASHQRALTAIDAGAFEKEIAPYRDVARDEGPRADTTLEKMAALRPLRPGGTITASMPHPAAFSACVRVPAEAIVTTPASFSAAISSGLGACANEATGTRRVTISRTRSVASGASARRFTPNGWGVRPAVSSIAFSSSARLIVADAIRPSPPALDTAAASRGPDT